MNSRDDIKPISWLRVACAFIVAPAAAALVCAAGLALVAWRTTDLGSLFWYSLTVLVLYAYPLTLVFAVPVFLLLRRRIEFNWRSGAGVGAAIGGGPLVLVNVASGSYLPSGHVASVLWGGAAQGLGAGALAGVAFWFIAAWKPVSGIAP